MSGLSVVPGLGEVLERDLSLLIASRLYPHGKYTLDVLLQLNEAAGQPSEQIAAQVMKIIDGLNLASGGGTTDETSDDDAEGVIYI